VSTDGMQLVKQLTGLESTVGLECMVSWSTLMSTLTLDCVHECASVTPRCWPRCHDNWDAGGRRVHMKYPSTPGMPVWVVIVQAPGSCSLHRVCELTEKSAGGRVTGGHEAVGSGEVLNLTSKIAGFGAFYCEKNYLW